MQAPAPNNPAAPLIRVLYQRFLQLSRLCLQRVAQLLRTLDQCRQDCCANSGTSRVRRILRGHCMLYGTGALYVALYTVPPVLFSGCRRYGVVHVR